MDIKREAIQQQSQGDAHGSHEAKPSLYASQHITAPPQWGFNQGTPMNPSQPLRRVNETLSHAHPRISHETPLPLPLPLPVPVLTGVHMTGIHMTGIHMNEYHPNITTMNEYHSANQGTPERQTHERYQGTPEKPSAVLSGPHWGIPEGEQRTGTGASVHEHQSHVYQSNQGAPERQSHERYTERPDHESFSERQSHGGYSERPAYEIPLSSVPSRGSNEYTPEKPTHSLSRPQWGITSSAPAPSPASAPAAGPSPAQSTYYSNHCTPEKATHSLSGHHWGITASASAPASAPPAYHHNQGTPEEHTLGVGGPHWGSTERGKAILQTRETILQPRPNLPSLYQNKRGKPTALQPFPSPPLPTPPLSSPEAQSQPVRPHSTASDPRTQGPKALEALGSNALEPKALESQLSPDRRMWAYLPGRDGTVERITASKDIRTASNQSIPSSEQGISSSNQAISASKQGITATEQSVAATKQGVIASPQRASPVHVSTQRSQTPTQRSLTPTPGPETRQAEASSSSPSAARRRQAPHPEASRSRQLGNAGDAEEAALNSDRRMPPMPPMAQGTIGPSETSAFTVPQGTERNHREAVSPSVPLAASEPPAFEEQRGNVRLPVPEANVESVNIGTGRGELGNTGLGNIGSGNVGSGRDESSRGESFKREPSYIESSNMEAVNVESSNRPRVSGISTTSDDGHQWLKYGEKRLIRAQSTRAYFRCSKWKDLDCMARKFVDVVYNEEEMAVPFVTYIQEHNHD